MNVLISNLNSRPIYEQITHQVKSQIISGKLKKGGVLPPMRVLARELQISVITTKRVHEDLERDDFLITRTGKGSFVAVRNVSAIQREHLRQIRELIPQAVRLAQAGSISLKQLSELLNQFCKGGSM